MALSDNDVVMLLDNAQLSKLARLLLHQEEPLMERIKSEPERVKYLKECNGAYDKVVSLLQDGEKFNKKFEGDENKADIANEIIDYIKYGINMSMQSIRNCSLRVTCIDKIKTHYKSLVTELQELDPENVSKHRLLAKEVSMYKQCMWEYTNKCKSGSARALSKAYSMVIKQEGIKFPDLVKKHKNQLGYEGEFESLEEAQKLEVYNSIIGESGRASIPKLELSSAGLGIAVLVVSAGLMVWDIFTAEHKIEAVLTKSFEAVSEIGAFAVQVAVEGAVTEAMLNVELGVFFVSLAGFVAGTVAGLLFVAVSGLLIDLILGGGGKTAPSLEELKFHTTKMPDGVALAFQIAYDGF